MARIQWTPVAASDISGDAIRAQQMAGASIQNAFSGFTDLLGGWETARRNDVMGDITRQQLTFSDPEAYRAALANGTINLQSDYLRPEDMMRVAGYQDTLTGRRNAETQYTQGNTRFANDQTLFQRGTDRYEREEEERKSFNAAFPDVLPLFEEARRTGRSDAILPALREIGVRRGLTGEQLNEFMTKGFSYAQEGRAVESHDLSQRSGENNLNQNITTFDQGQEARLEGRNVTTLLATAQGLAGVNFDDKSPGGGAEMALRMAAEGGNYSAREIAAAAQQMGVAAPVEVLAQLQAETGNSAPRNVGPTRSFSGEGGSRVTVGADQEQVRSVLAGAGMPTHVIAGFLGNFEVEGGYGGARGDGGSAYGIAQWRGPRAENFRRVIGKPVGSATIAEQARYVAWEMANPTHPSVGMTIRQRDAIVNAPNAEVAAQRIDQFYERSSGEHRDRRVSAARSFADARWGGTLNESGAGLNRNAEAAAAQGRTPQINPADPTSFIPAFESRMMNVAQGLSRQGGAAGLGVAARYNSTQAMDRNPGVAAAAALAAGANGAPGGVFAGSRVDQAMLETAAIRLMRDVPGLTSDTAISVLADAGARVNGRNYLGQAAGNVQALGGGVRVDMVRATQIARALNGQGGALLAESAANVTRGQQQAAQITAQMTDALNRYKAGAAADARQYGEGQVSPGTRAYGERLIALQAQLEDVSRTGEGAARAFAGNRAPAPTPAPGAPPARRPVASGPPTAITPQRQANARQRRTDFINSFSGWGIGQVAAPLLNTILDSAERNRR